MEKQQIVQQLTCLNHFLWWNKKINKTGGHQTFSGGLPPFSHHPIPIPLSPSWEGFLLLPIGRPFTGTHRPTIYRAFSFIYLCFSRLEARQALLCTSLCLLGILFRVVLSAITALLNSPTPSLRFLPTFSHIFPSNVNDKAAGFLPHH